VTLLVLLLPAIALATNWPLNNRRQYFVAQDYISNIIRSVGRDGLLLTCDWQVQSPALYTREVEGRRPDLKLVDLNLLRRSWYFDYLERAYPLLLQRSRDKVDAFVSELRQWERDPGAYAKSPALAQAIERKHQEMLQSFVNKESEVGPVCFTSDLLYAATNEEAFSKWMRGNYQLIPRGLVFQLSKDPAFADPGELRLETRGLADGTVRFEQGDVINLKVLPAYTTMLLSRGRYLASFGQHERAIEAFKQTLALAPNLPLAREGLAESEKKLQSRPANDR
jgi:tetratricopeptide (TPR) repeat protein